MAKSAQLEREAEDTRAQLARTLDELRERITPGQLVDQAVDYAKDSGGGMFVRNLGRQTAANPLPVALIGAGMAWLMLANGRQSGTTAASINRAAETAIDRARQSMREVGEQVKEFGQTTSARAADTAADASDWMDDWNASAATSSSGRPLEDMADAAQESARQSARDAGGRANAAASAYDTAKSSASEAYGRFAGQAQRTTADMKNAASSFGQRTADAGRDFLQFCRSQPLLLAGIGMALGAIVGAVIPPTESEDALMGETSDAMKDEARDFAEEQVEKAKSTVTSAAQSAAQAGLNQTEEEFDFGGRQSKAGPSPAGEVPAETSLVPEAEHSSEESATAERPNQPAWRDR